MNRKVLFAVFALLVCFLIVSCDENQQLIINPTTPSPTIRGTVSIPDGTDLSGGDFYIRVMEGEKAVYTGRVKEDGSFSIPGLSEEATYSILLTTEEPGDIKGTERDISRATTSGYGGWLSNVTASINEQAGVGSIKVKPLGTIKGVVKKDGAEDNYDTTVYIPGTSYLAMTDGEGNFSLFNVPQATYTLRYISNGYMAKMVENVVLYSESDTENPVTTVQQQTLIKNAGNLIGTISKTGSTDHSNSTVMLSDGEKTFTGSTGADGSLLISNIIPGTYTATISTSGFLTQTVEGIVIEAAKNTTIQPVNLVANGGSILGTISLNNNGDKAGAIITAKSMDSDYFYTASTNADGIFAISNAFPGNYVITISKAGYTSVTIENVSSVAGQTTQIGTTNLSSMYGSVAGNVRLSENADNSGVTVTLTFTADPTIALTTVSGADGTYTFSNLANAGQYSVTFSKDGYVSSTGTVVTVTLGQNQSIDDVTLRSLDSRVSGTVTLAETQDYTGISVLLKATDNSIQYDATTDQQGSYVMARVKPGEYTLTVSKAGYVSKTVNDIIVESSMEKTLDSVSLLVGSRSITGSITAELKTDYSGFLVTATNLADEHKVYSAITNTSGAYTLAEMVPGEYQIVVSHTGYRTLTLPTVNVVEGTTKTIETYNVEINRGTIYGKATLEGRTSSAGVKVELLQGTVVYDTQYTDEIGDYSFYVPQGNYSGVRFSLEDFRSESNQDVMALFADNYVRVPDVELVATHNTVRGVVDVFKGVEDVENSNVTLSFDNNTQIAPVITGEDGAFEFRHVPVSDSKYYLRIERENCSDIVLQITVEAADEINLGVISMYSNTGTIKGQVVLDGEYDSSGILVSIATGKEDLTTYTDVTGRYELGGIPAGQVFTVTYSKTGWDAATVQIDPVLEALEVRNIDSITMTDSIAPVLESIVINSGANTTASKSVSIQINASDNGGSGITLMQYSWTGDFSMSEWKSYDSYKTMEIPTEDNGQKTLMLRVRDKSGNMSEIKTDSIELVDQIKVYHGTLSGEDLHWTKEKSPIVITGDITIPAGTVLIIDPGVDVFFDGYYSINVEGYINAIGTDAEHIIFNSTNDFVTDLTGNEGYCGSWGGIVFDDNPLIISRTGYEFVFEAGSIISHSEISGINDGICGPVYLEEDTILSTSSALGGIYGGKSYYFSGALINCIVYGSVSMKERDYISTYYVYGNQFCSLPSQTTNQGIGIDWSSLSIVEQDWVMVNNYFENASVGLGLGFFDVSNCTFNNCEVYLSGKVKDCWLSNCLFINSKYSIHGDWNSNAFDGIILSNFLNNSSMYLFNAGTAKSTQYIVKDDLRFNYWGEAYTKELNLNDKYGIKNASFILDYYDDNTLRQVMMEGYISNAWPFAGYLGDEFEDYQAKCTDVISTVANTVTAASDIHIGLTMQTSGEIAYYRINQSLDELLASDWIPYTGVCIYPADSIDLSLLNDGSLELFVQCKTDTSEMSVKMISVNYSAPMILCSLPVNSIFNLSVPQKITFSVACHNLYCFNDNDVHLYIDDIAEDVEFVPGDGSNNLCRSYRLFFEPSLRTNGYHELKITAFDRSNNETSLIIPFYVDLPSPSFTSMVLLNESDTVTENNPLQIKMSLSDAKHLKYIRVLSDGNVISTTEYEDNGSNTVTDKIISVGYDLLEAGGHVLMVELEDYVGNITKSEVLEYIVQ